MSQAGRWILTGLILAGCVGYIANNGDKRTPLQIETAKAESRSDGTQVRGLLAAAYAAGATQADYTIYREIKVTISSLLPGQARQMADGLCQIGKAQTWNSPWTILVYLPVGDRPAAICWL